jgi:competence protein ComEC
MHRPIILLTLALVAGILLGQAFLFFPWSTIAFSIALAAAGSTLLATARIGHQNLLFTVTGAVSGFALLVVAAAHLPERHYRTMPVFDGTAHELTGRISSPLDRDPGRTAFSLNLDRIDGREASGTVRVAVRDETLPAGYGDRVSLSGRLYPPRGFRNPGGFDYPAYLARNGVHAVLSLRRGTDVRVLEQGSGVLRTIQDLRERIRQAMLAGLKGDGAAILLAMTIGEEGSLTEDLRERFMAAGVTHIISISGSHLGMVAVICFWLTRNALFLLPERSYHWLTIHADPRKIAALATIIPVVFYAFLAGGQVATMRSLIMILAGLAALTLDREGDLLSALAIAALVSLVPDPQALFDISFQLSYLSVLCIAFVVSTWNALELRPEKRAGKLLNSALLLFSISAAAALVTGPLVAFYFHQVSFAGIAANMVVVPFAGAVVVPLGLTSGILSLLTGSLPFAAANQFFADAFVALVSLFARIPFAAVHLSSPGPLLATGYAGLLIASALWLRARLFAAYRPLETSSRPPRFTLAAMSISAVVIVLSAVFPLLRGHGPRVTVVDVGQGDCTLVETAAGRTILIDGGGTRDNRFDIGRSVLAPYLWDRGIRVFDLVVLSHPHPDHMNGLIAVLRNFTVREVWGSGLDTDLPGYADFQEVIRQRSIPFRKVSAGDRARVGEADLFVLHPGAAFRQRTRKAYAAENDRSLVVRLELAGKRLLFAGDIHAEGERELQRNVSDLAVDLVKVPHHGSRTSSTGALVAALRPAAAVITVGDGNPYRHPAEEVVERYQEIGATVYRTDRHGAIMVRLSPAGLDVRPWSELLLRQAVSGGQDGWWTIERSNWMRMAIRTAGI